MVLESILKAKRAEKHPLYVLLLGILYGSIGIIFDLWLFNSRIANLFITITVFAGIPLIHKIIMLEEKKDRQKLPEKNLLKEHEKALTAFIMLFLGVLIAFTFWYTILPLHQVESLFAAQLEEIPAVREMISGRVVSPGSFLPVIIQNLKVLIFSFILSFFFGAGAIFILTWNAALIAVALGSFLRVSFASSTSTLPPFLMVLGTLSYGFFGYISHGIFEMAAYFLAGLAGGIISVAVIRHDLFSRHFNRIVADSLWLLGISILLLLAGGIVETMISPFVFS